MSNVHEDIRLVRKAVAEVDALWLKTTIGPWATEVDEHEDMGGADIYHHIVAEITHVAEVKTDGDDAAWIVAMNPEIAKPLTAMLAAFAQRAEEIAEGMPPSNFTRSTVVADTVVGWTYAVILSKRILNHLGKFEGPTWMEDS